MTRALVVGSTGLMGRAVSKELSLRGYDLFQTSRLYNSGTYYLPLESCPIVLHIPKVDIVFMCAYVTSVDQCERDTSTWIANVSAQIRIIDCAEKMGARVVFPSSSYVFGWDQIPRFSVGFTEEETPTPRNVYGQQKLAVEQRIMASPYNHLILRTVGLFGEDDPRRINYPYQVYNSMVFKAPIDQYINPIHVEDFASIAVGLVEMGQSGIFNVAGDKHLIKHRFATKIAKAFEERGVAVPFPDRAFSSALEQQAVRPRFGSLDTAKVEELGFETPSLEKGIEKFVERVLEQDAELHLSSTTSS